MSAQLDCLPHFRRMLPEDLDAVMAIEETIYSHPWTHGNFSDSLQAGHSCWIMECGGCTVGYAVMMTGAGEAHLLNLSVAGAWQRRGLGREQLHFVMDSARKQRADKIVLEVRVSNAPARALYAQAGFQEIGARRGYYPAHDGREDAIVLEYVL